MDLEEKGIKCTNYYVDNNDVNNNYVYFNEYNKLHIPEGTSILYFDNIDDKCTNKFFDLVLPKSLKKIKNQCFRKCKYIRNLTLNENLEKIGCCSFRGCTNLKILNKELLKNVKIKEFAFGID